ncbi:MAG: AAA family ATPase, partial [Kiritimatiellia bacterium]|nr:AAA family ATPase [Kiritimatiellia bacterium]
RSAFLWGPRKTGKSYWLRQNYPDAVTIDLLKTDVYAEYASRPSLLRERYGQHLGLVVIDEVQMVPDLLNEVHWLIENRRMSFLLTGSSARKLRRNHANLLGGRAWRFTMAPLTVGEVEGFDLEKAMISGLLPPHYMAEDPILDLRAYIGDYLREEVAAEARVQNIPSFAEFLHAAALTNGELLNYTNIARECGVSAKVVRGYFGILEDTLLGFRLPPWRRAVRRRLIECEKFYLFDVGVANFLARRRPVEGTPEFGKAFEHFLMMEIRAYQAYRNPDLPLSYWRTSSGLEVDIVLGDMATAVEIKGTSRFHEGDGRGLRALREETKVKRTLAVCLERQPRILDDGTEVCPWPHFLERLWAGEMDG